MRAQRPAASASSQCQRCTAVVLRGSARCTLCGWPVGTTYPPVEGDAPPVVEEVSDEPQAEDPATDQAAHDAQLDALAVMAARRAPAPVEPEVVAAELAAPPVADEPVDEVAARPEVGDLEVAEAAEHETQAVAAPVATLAAAAPPAVAQGLGSHRRSAPEPGSLLPDAPSAGEAVATPPPAEVMATTEPTFESPAHHAAGSPSRTPGVLPASGGPVGTLGRRAVMAMLGVPAVWALSVLFGLFAVSMFDQSMHAVLTGRDASPTLSMTGLLLLATSLLTLLALAVAVVATVFFLLWVSRARSTVAQLSPVPQRWSPTWSVAGWLIPLFNLYLGWQVLEDLWRGSDPVHRTTEGRPVFATSSAPVQAWLASAVGVVVVVVLTGVLIGGSLLGEVLRLVAVAVSAWCLSRVVSRISSWQDEALRG